MTPVYKLSASSIKGRTNYGSMLAGNTAYTPPSWYESIATVTVGSGGSSTITFSSIPGTYTHLQIRGMALTTASGGSPQVRFNSDTGNNYSNHYVYGSGTAAATGANTSISGMYIGGSNTGTSTTNPFVFVTDILDYTNTNKNTTIRTLSGLDSNGNGEISLFSGAWYNTAAITSIDIYATSKTFAQYSHFALYGIKGA